MKGPAAPVVVGVDGSSSALEAVRWAAGDCARHHAPLRLVHGCLLPTRGYPEVVLTSTEVRLTICAPAANGDQGELVQTCVSAAAGAVEIDR